MYIYSINCDCSSYMIALKKQGNWVRGPKCRECGTKLGRLQWTYFGTAAGSTPEEALKTYNDRTTSAATPNGSASSRITTLEIQVADLISLCEVQDEDIQDLKKGLRELELNVSDLRSDLEELGYLCEDNKTELRRHEDYQDHGEDNEVSSDDFEKLGAIVKLHEGRLWDLENDE